MESLASATSGDSAEWVTVVVQFLLVAVFGTWAWVVRNAGRDIRDEMKAQREEQNAELTDLRRYLETVRDEFHQQHILHERRVTRVESGLEFLLRSQGAAPLNHIQGKDGKPYP